MNNFVWTDLSTYCPPKSIEFYKTIFDWDLIEDNGYTIGFIGGKAVVGIYETPDFFKKIKMPHFWMNYIQVEDLDAKVEKVRMYGGIVEIADAEFYQGRIALIRDPLGAGFTIYEGTGFQIYGFPFHGSVCARELHASDMNVVRSFYENLFDWKIEPITSSEFLIKNNIGDQVARMLEFDNNIKGKYEYWTNIFWVDNLRETQFDILENGGQVVSEETNRTLCTDAFGEAFFYIQEII